MVPGKHLYLFITNFIHIYFLFYFLCLFITIFSPHTSPPWQPKFFAKFLPHRARPPQTPAPNLSARVPPSPIRRQSLPPLPTPRRNPQRDQPPLSSLLIPSSRRRPSPPATSLPCSAPAPTPTLPNRRFQIRQGRAIVKTGDEPPCSDSLWCYRLLSEPPGEEPNKRRRTAVVIRFDLATEGFLLATPTRSPSGGRQSNFCSCSNLSHPVQQGAQETAVHGLVLKDDKHVTRREWRKGLPFPCSHHLHRPLRLFLHSVFVKVKTSV